VSLLAEYLCERDGHPVDGPIRSRTCAICRTAAMRADLKNRIYAVAVTLAILLVLLEVLVPNELAAESCV
jgi:hypothetical protein